MSIITALSLLTIAVCFIGIGYTISKLVDADTHPF